jgi:hypothetical protein
MLLGTAPGAAQQPSSTLQAKSKYAARIALEAAQGPLRIVVLYRAPAGPGFATLHTPNENVAAAVSENRSAQDSIISTHIGPPAGLLGPDRALRRMEVTPAFAINAAAAEIEALATDSRVINIAIDEVRRPVLIQSVPLIGIPVAASSYGATGAGWAVAIISTSPPPSPSMPAAISSWPMPAMAR